MKIFQPAILGRLASMYSPFCLNLSDFSAGTKIFILINLHAKGAQINHRHCRFILFIEIIIAMKGVLSLLLKKSKNILFLKYFFRNIWTDFPLTLCSLLLTAEAITNFLNRERAKLLSEEIHSI